MSLLRKLLPLGAVTFLALVGTAVQALALSYPLSSTAIRDAYFIGNRNDEQTGEFLSRYIRSFPAPKSGPYIREIGFNLAKLR